MRNDLRIYFLFLLMFLFIGFLIGMQINNFLILEKWINPLDAINVVPKIIIEDNLTTTNCSNQTSLTTTVECFNNEYSKWFKYNYSQGDNSDINYLKRHGGNCLSMTNLWNSTLTSLGFTTSPTYMFPSPLNNNSVGHVYLTAYNSINGSLSEYCNLDLLNYQCYKFVENIPI